MKDQDKQEISKPLANQQASSGLTDYHKERSRLLVKEMMEQPLQTSAKAMKAQKEEPEGSDQELGNRRMKMKGAGERSGQGAAASRQAVPERGFHFGDVPEHKRNAVISGSGR